MKSCLLMALAVVGAATQSMLPESVTLSGAVTDTTGKPLSDVWIYHSGVAVETIKTNAQGHFEIKTRAPAIVFRKDGFQSQYLRVAENRHLSIVLTGSPPLRECGTWGRCLTLKGFRSSLCLPRVHGVNAGKQGNDVDYGQRWFWFETKNGKVGIQHAAGPMWGGGFPSDQQVWWSSDYRETSYRDQQGFAIADARGKSPDGKLWRTLGHWGEAASYRGVSPEDAPRLDRVLDGVCLAGTGSGHTKENN